jgi:EpsI family protein
MVCFALLFVQMRLMGWLSGKRSFGSVFAVELPARGTPELEAARPLSAPAWVAVALLGVTTIPALLLPQRVEIAPRRADFSAFPMQLAAWSGHRQYMEGEFIDALRFTDYIMADYAHPSGSGVNFYVAYYESQRKGESAHSPKVCLPGGGWVIQDFTQRVIPAVLDGGRGLSVNRALIVHGGERELVYYWFQQRGRIITGEYQVKWFLFWDALTRNRSDGSLVRLIAPIAPGSSEAQADANLQEFARTIAPVLAQYIPG